MNELQDLHRAVDFGVQVGRFLNGEVGQYLIQRAQDEREAALEALAAVDPEDAKMIRTLQARIGVVDRIQQWLEEAISAAQSATARLQQMEQED